MSTYHLRVNIDAVEDVDNLDGSVSKRVAPKIFWLARYASKTKHKALTGGRWKNKYSKHVAKDWRIVYELDANSQIVTVIRVAHRSEVYENPPPS